MPASTPDGDDPAVLDAWPADGAAGTAAALREAGPDTEVWSWYRDRDAGRRLAPDNDRAGVLGDGELLDFWLERSSFG